MPVSLDIPFLSYENLGKRANEFLRDHRVWSEVPVPIEEIIEFQLEIAITPICRLERDCDIQGFISSDLKSITVDQDLMERHVPIYRFTLTHEIAHLLVHKDVFARYPVSTIAEYRAFRALIALADYLRLEQQADMLAGQILVPRHHLVPRLNAAKRLIEQQGISVKKYGDIVGIYVAEELAGQFGVSRSVVEIELRRNHLS